MARYWPYALIFAGVVALIAFLVLHGEPDRLPLVEPVYFSVPDDPVVRRSTWNHPRAEPRQ